MNYSCCCDTFSYSESSERALNPSTTELSTFLNTIEKNLISNDTTSIAPVTSLITYGKNLIKLYNDIESYRSKHKKTNPNSVETYIKDNILKPYSDNIIKTPFLTQSKKYVTDLINGEDNVYYGFEATPVATSLLITKIIKEKIKPVHALIKYEGI